MFKMFHSSKKLKLKLSKATRYRQRVTAATTVHKLFNSSSSSSSIESVSNVNKNKYKSPSPSVSHQYNPIGNQPSTSANINNLNEDYSNVESLSSYHSSDNNDISSDSDQCIKDPLVFISNWALCNSIPHTVLNDLLICLRKFPGLNNLPKDSRTLLQTPTNTTIKNNNGGEYHHLGLKHEIQLLLKSDIDIPQTIELTVGMMVYH